MIRKLLKVTLYIAIAIAFAALITGLVLLKQWPWWVGAALGAGILSVLFALLFIKKYLLRRREQKFVQQVIAQDQSAIGQRPLHEQRHLQALQDKWKASVDLLRQSNLKKHGNPLYVLPWYMVLGESGSGKTTAIKNAKANSPVSEVSAGISGTRNFDWWFFDEAIILDTAGRYSIPIDHEPDREEWERFLTLVAKYRKKEPLNGIILTVSADHLLMRSADDLRENGLNLRKRMDQLMRVCGAKFPVYLMVTKIDRVHGFNEFSQMLPGDRMNQAMGYSTEDPADDWQKFLDTAHQFICDRLKDLRLLIIQGTPRINAGALLFPDEFNKLYAGLKAFAEGAFKENPYQETPMFMGIYYSSGKQGEKPCSEFIDHFNITAAAPANPRNGIFLRDFFKKILPGDRNLFRPILEYFKWRRLTKQFGLTAWCLFWFSLLGLISFSYIKNIETIEEINLHAQSLPVFTNELSTDLLVLGSYADQLKQVRQLNKNWIVPRFGFDHSLQMERQYVDRYIEHFQTHLLLPMDRQLKAEIGAFDENTSDETIAEYAGHITTRITILKNYLAGDKPESEQSLAAMSAEMLHVMDPEMPDDIARRFGRNYYRYLELNTDRQSLAVSIETLQVHLRQLLDARDMNLDWVTAKKLPGVVAIGMDRYWGELTENARNASYPVVDAPYTWPGRTRIDSFIGRMGRAVEDSPRLAAAEDIFWQRYENTYLQKWANFAVNFPEGRNYLPSYQRRKALARAMATADNPYFSLLSEMTEQLQGMENLPAWAAALVEIEKIRNTRTESEDDQPSFTDRLRNRSDAAARTVTAITAPDMARQKEKRLKAAEAWDAYVKTLDKLQPVGSTPETAYEMAGEFFSPSASASGEPSPFLETQDQLQALKVRLKDGGDLSVAETLVNGPLDYLANFATQEAGRVIQQHWETMVLSDARGIDPHKVPYRVFNRAGGTAWEFLDGPASPFIARGKDGFHATTALGQSVPFLREFLTFLDQGADGTVDVKDQYSVKISTLPIQVNDDADIFPRAVFLRLSCDQGPIQLENYNFQASKQFDWRMDGCGDVTLTIQLPDTRLRYTYAGDMGFARFLEDFRHGFRKFTPGDFPRQSELLKNRGIAWIRIAYRLKNAQPVIDLLKDVPHAVPVTIVDSR